MFYCYYFTVWGYFCFNVLDVEEQDRKNVLNMLAKAFHFSRGYFAPHDQDLDEILKGFELILSTYINRMETASIVPTPRPPSLHTMSRGNGDAIEFSHATVIPGKRKDTKFGYTVRFYWTERSPGLQT